MKTMVEQRSIIFLDLDGVLITTPPWKPDVLHADGYSDFNLSCVSHFNRLLPSTEAKVVLTSSRRSTKTTEEWKAVFTRRGIASAPETCALQLPGNPSRRKEIETYLDSYRPGKFVILDDDASLEGLSSDIRRHWVRTFQLTGFTGACCENALRILTK